MLITTLTKRMAEDLTKYFLELRVKVTYMHSDIDTMERMKIIRDLRLGDVDVLVGINLLREGLDIPEVALVAILDADKEGFLRSETSLIQTIGRAARNSESHVILYADNVTNSMKKAMDETERRRKLQGEYNKKHNITPTTIVKDVRNIIEVTKVTEDVSSFESLEEAVEYNKEALEKALKKLAADMNKASKNLEFEKAAFIRDEIWKLKKELKKNENPLTK